MQLDPTEHFEAIVLPAIGAHRAAEQALSEVGRDAPPEEHARAESLALREGGAAALYLHHFADIVARRGGPGLEDLQGELAQVREFLGILCRRHGGGNEVEILADVADALKHAVLTRRLPREVEEAGQVLTIDRPYGRGKYGEGRYGAPLQVWVLARSGRRTLSAILSAVADAWQRALAGERG